jgi:hypothetical protein
VLHIADGWIVQRSAAPFRSLAALLAVGGMLATAQSSAALGLPPVNVTPPSISGSAVEGATVSCSQGIWLNSPTGYSYSWQRDVTGTIGGSNNTYTLTAGDVGHAITCTVVASNGAGSSLVGAVSLPITPAAAPVALVPINTSPPSISGTYEQGQTVTCSQGAWSNGPTGYGYSWQRNVTTTIAGNTSTYTVTSGDVNQAITCTVVASNGSGSSVPAISAPIIPTAPSPPADVLPPSISGTAQVGQTLTCSTGTWTIPPTSYAYSWQRNGSDVAGQASQQYTLTSSDNTALITCTVVAYNGPTPSVLPATSPPVGPVSVPVPGAPLNLSPPAISGSAVQGQTVTCSQGAWFPAATSYAYSWQRNVLTAIGGTSNQYTLTADDVGQAITCAVVGRNSVGASPPAVSLPIIPTLTSSGSGGNSSGGSGGNGSGGSSGGTGGSTSFGGNGDVRRPTVKAFSVLPRRMIVSVHGRRQRTKGVTFRYTLDRGAAVLIVVQRRVTGRVVGKRCVATTRRNQKARGCARHVTVKTILVKNAKKGANRLRYAGRSGKRLLPTSSYRAVLTAGDSAGWSKAKPSTFAVVRKQA